jgi:uncharacterized protein YdeI (YjbR/CyaY-like superfamily)
MDIPQRSRAFAAVKPWSTWIARNHTSSDGIWVRFFKKASGKKTVTYEEVLEEALCYGWIDGQSKGLDEASWVQRFTPRRPRSLWSKRNRERVALLTAAGRMRPAGLREVEAAKADGRWDQAYDSPKSMEVPPDFLKAVRKNREAYAFYKTLNKANTYAIAWRLQTARKPETRTRRMETLLAMLARREKLR